jgi:hypothetical protein
MQIDALRRQFLLDRSCHVAPQGFISRPNSQL